MENDHVSHRIVSCFGAKVCTDKKCDLRTCTIFFLTYSLLKTVYIKRNRRRKTKRRLPGLWYRRAKATFATCRSGSWWSGSLQGWSDGRTSSPAANHLDITEQIATTTHPRPLKHSSHTDDNQHSVRYNRLCSSQSQRSVAELSNRTFHGRSAVSLLQTFPIHTQTGRRYGWFFALPQTYLPSTNGRQLSLWQEPPYWQISTSKRSHRQPCCEPSSCSSSRCWRSAESSRLQSQRNVKESLLV